ncbi:MAG: signal peptidase II [Clostridia bacterium]|nr:signal peptidase II [Clostridia bacterium]
MNKRNYVIALIIIILDQLTKLLVINRNIEIIPNFFNITYTQNTGAAFGIGTLNIITTISILLLISIIVFIIKENKRITHFTPFVLIISGTIGNLIDRIFRGYVIDFIDINLFNFPNFNIADICITTGIFTITFMLVKQKI